MQDDGRWPAYNDQFLEVYRLSRCKLSVVRTHDIPLLHSMFALPLMTIRALATIWCAYCLLPYHLPGPAARLGNFSNTVLHLPFSFHWEETYRGQHRWSHCPASDALSIPANRSTLDAGAEAVGAKVHRWRGAGTAGGDAPPGGRRSARHLQPATRRGALPPQLRHHGGLLRVGALLAARRLRRRR